MDLGLQDKVVVVAGSTRGIGRAIAATFLDEGAVATISGRHASDVSATVKDLAAAAGAGRVFGHVGDLSSTAGCEACVKAAQDRWGRLDVVVANIGDGAGTRGWDVGDEEWERRLDQNFYSAVRLARAALPAMTEAGSGSIVFISSIAGIEALDAPLPYTVSKAGLVPLARALARSLGPKNIRVNVVAPGNILCPGGTWATKMQQDRKAVLEYVRREVPLGRFGAPEEIASLVAFLASERSGFVSGTCVIADGGQIRSF